VVAEVAKKAADAAARLTHTDGREGLEELRSLYPDSYFYWEGLFQGLIILWRGNPARIPMGVDKHAAYVQDLRTGRILKNRGFEGDLPDQYLPDEAKVAIVMES
jgi:hypothetical protein